MINPTFVSLPRPRGYEAGLEMAVEPTGDAVIVRVKTAKLTYPVLSSFFEQVRAIVEDGTRKLVLDLEAVNYIDSETIGCLVDIHRCERPTLRLGVPLSNFCFGGCVFHASCRSSQRFSSASKRSACSRAVPPRPLST